jgi:hypothetical protein
MDREEWRVIAYKVLGSLLSWWTCSQRQSWLSYNIVNILNVTEFLFKCWILLCEHDHNKKSKHTIDTEKYLSNK